MIRVDFVRCFSVKFITTVAVLVRSAKVSTGTARRAEIKIHKVRKGHLFEERESSSRSCTSKESKVTDDPWLCGGIVVRLRPGVRGVAEVAEGEFGAEGDDQGEVHD